MALPNKPKGELKAVRDPEVVEKEVDILIVGGGMAACGALLEVESGYGRFIGVSAMPSSQTIYGIVVMLTLNVGITPENAPGIFGIGLGSYRLCT